MARQTFSAEQVESKREQILDAAMQLFEDSGLSAVSFRKISSLLGCSYSAPYRYFSSKEELVTALRARAYRWIEQAMLEAIAPYTEPLTQLNVLADAYIRAGLERPNRYALMFFELEGSDLGQRSLELAAAKRDSLGVCTKVVTAAHNSGALQLTTDPLTASHLFWAGAHGLVSLQVAGQFVMGRTIDALVPTMIATLMAGLQHPQLSADSPPRKTSKTKNTAAAARPGVAIPEEPPK
ncbi:TetR/AcrR family transcriptional regulator [Sinimarinibacterium sp. CAU 1509]|uniref:TetR/AcrR family transcriptional regulator n=1 Tax=Sinimarinibacterium sp. CAU 1509 TaxID=2562283 RepID=UPI0010AC8BA1|nr:TetR/AcrR family transcriptional regulator [Sinimarinibacterium sp. CAU 1509]TJY64792.1 TetR/AcrR family transcriptional regulator [Sinimarinibacterium sp. CAU 1509]